MAGQFKALLEDMADSDKLSRANRAFLTRTVGDFRTEKVLDTIQAKLRLPSFPPNSPISIFITLLPWARDIAEGTKNIEEWTRETNTARAMWLEFAEATKRHLSLIAQGQDLPLLPKSGIPETELYRGREVSENEIERLRLRVALYNEDAHMLRE